MFFRGVEATDRKELEEEEGGKSRDEGFQGSSNLGSDSIVSNLFHFPPLGARDWGKKKKNIEEI